MGNIKFLLIPTICALNSVFGLAWSQASDSHSVIKLRDWALQSSCETRATADQISSPRFDSHGWHAVTVPATVVAGLVADRSYPDPFVGMNLRSLLGVSYPIGEMFANIPMPEESPFHCSWWYRTEFQSRAVGRRMWLHFDGINYRANIWLNGQKIGTSVDVAGTFRQFEFEVSDLLHRSGSNALAVEVFAPESGDLALTFVDWNPMPPDKNMGLWRDVYLAGSGDVSLRHVFVQSKLDSSFDSAGLAVFADLRNASSRAIRGVLRTEFEGKRFEEPVELASLQHKEVELTAVRHPELKLAHARLWWPSEWGAPELYTAKFSFVIDGRISDRSTVTFGVREISSELTSEGYRLFRINGRPVLIRGAGWTSDMLQRWSPQRMKAELKYAKDIGLNTIRLEGQLERDEFFNLTDRMGLLVMAGWTCCNAWERWSDWKKEQVDIARFSLLDQIRRLRNHPSLLVWLYGSDNHPPAEVEAMYLDVLRSQHWPNPSLSSASQQSSSVTGNTGVKMLGPYDYVPPNYWLIDKEAGGAFGFNTETGPGPAIPPLESLKRFLRPDHLWPIDDQWNLHAGSKRFSTLDHFTESLTQRYGAPADLDDYLRKSDAMAYEGERAMFEAYARNKYRSTGVIQWMLNNAWPSLIWHLYDNFLVPAGGYFGAKKACEAVHIQYSYDDGTIAVVNDRLAAIDRLEARARVFDLHSKLLFERKAIINVPADAVVRAFQLPNRVEGLTSAYFLQLELANDSGFVVSRNFYWLSTDPDIMDWSKRIGTAYTPQKAWANLRSLAELPKTKISATAFTRIKRRTATTHVVLHNLGSNIALLLRLRLTEGENKLDITPIYWQDNYVSLLPGEQRDIEVSYQVDAAAKKTTLIVSGLNQSAITIAVPLAKAR
jgi:exo-1,4-beta-D-glucosaminidase